MEGQDENEESDNFDVLVHYAQMCRVKSSYKNNRLA